ncbi:MAG: metalloregulator ArsR/SmtB family transcription factor [Candidatus Latescibacteria bacterium]|nr:metalloregulator ArsR/SmtB family transcription factor [Candidatus Latescibacterota bacterium]
MKSPNRRFKEAIYEQFARISKALSSPRRLELLDLLCQGPRTVEILAGEAGLSVANTSQHLRALRTARLVEASKEGQFVTYRLADEAVCEFFHTLRQLAESRLAEIEQLVQQYLAQRELLEPVDQEQLLSQVRKGEVVALDVRPPEEYQAGHIPGALSVPLEELEQRLVKLPKERTIVAYCRGPYCVLAVEAVELLRRKGFKAVRLEDGVHDWRRRGFRVAAGEQP